MNQTKKQRPFRKKTILQGWIEFCDESGRWYRAENKGNQIWALYEKNGNAFVYCNTVSIGKKFTCRDLLEAHRNDF